MPTFRYTAVDSEGRLAQGEVDASDRASALNELSARGWKSIQLRTGGSHERDIRLSDHDVEEVVVTLAEVSDSQLPLAEGLRAAASECTNRRVAAALGQIAADIERGIALEAIVNERGQFLPAHVRGLIAAASGTERLGIVLEELVEHHRAAREWRSQMVSSMAYPATISLAALLILAATFLWIVPQFERMFVEWGVELTATTELMIGFSRLAIWMVAGEGAWIVLAGTLTAVVIAIATRFCLGSSGWHHTISVIPLIGKMKVWSGAAGFARLLATMLDQGIPMPRALALVADGVSDPFARHAARILADGAAGGRSLSEMLTQSPHLPASIVPFVRWGETTGQLPESLRVANDMLLARLRARVLILQSILPPLWFVVVGNIIGLCLAGLFSPLIGLIQSLS